MPSPAGRRGAAGRYVETLGSPVSQKRHGVSGAARSPTRGPVLTALGRDRLRELEGDRAGAQVGAVLLERDAERAAEPGRARAG